MMIEILPGDAEADLRLLSIRSRSRSRSWSLSLPRSLCSRSRPRSLCSRSRSTSRPDSRVALFSRSFSLSVRSTSLGRCESFLPRSHSRTGLSKAYFQNIFILIEHLKPKIVENILFK